MPIALVDKHIKELIKNENIIYDFDLNKYVQPASLDLPIGSHAYLVGEKILPYNRNISEILKTSTIDKISLKNGAVLLKGHTYLIPSIHIFFKGNYFASTSSKSSIGRVDLMVRTIFDNSGLYDIIPKNTTTNLWLEVTPQSFNIKIKEGMALNQMMIFEESKNFVDFKSEKFIYNHTGKVLENKTHNNALLLSLQVGENEFIGYEAISTSSVIDLEKIGEYNWQEFFRKINSTEGKIILEKDRFYILTTKEKISIPYNFSAEMVPFSHLVGELRAHYAGFFDPGFGYSENEEINGSIGVLEVRPHETISVYDGQPICLMEFFKNKENPTKPYGHAGNNYFKQSGPKLAKYFK